MTSPSAATPEALLSLLDRLLKAHPDNRPARQMRADTLLGLGRITDANADADYLCGKSPDDYMPNQVRASIAAITGNRTEELAAYQRMAAAKPDSDSLAQALREPVDVLQARIKELQGDKADSAAIWKKLVSTAAPNDQRFVRGYAEFLIRQEDYADAADLYQRLVSESAKLQNQQNLLASDQMQLASVLWASGKVRDASAQADAALKTIEHWNDPFGKRSPLLPQTSLMSYSLKIAAAGGNAASPPSTKGVFDFAPTSGATEKLDDFELAVAALTGKVDVKIAMDRLEETLKAAPFLDSALWAETYLGLTDPALRKRAAEHLSAGTMQRHLMYIG
jgi:tetratricopeptide (TPR) repeat protein